jgi:hypothetical protein
LTRVAIAREINNPIFDFASYYRFSWHATYCYFDLVTYALSFIFGVFWAGKIALTIYLSLLIGATRSLLKSISAPIFPFILWPLLFAYNWWFWIGSINLLVGFCFGMFAIALTLKNKDLIASGKWTAGFLWRLPCLLTICFVCHPFSAFLTMAVTAPLALSLRFKGVKKAIALSAFVLFVIAAQATAHAYYHQGWDMLTNLGRAQWLLHDFYAPPTQARVFKIAFFAAFCLWLFTKKKDMFQCFFLPSFLVVLVLLTPHAINISGDNDLRCSFFAFLLVPLFVPSPSRRAWQIFLSIVFLCCGLYWNAVQIKKQLSYDGAYREIERIAQSHVPPAPRVRPLVMNRGLPDQQAAVYITFYKGGFSPFMFESSLHGLAYIKRPECPGPEAFEKLYPKCSAFYNCLIVYKNEGYEEVMKENDVAAMGFVKRFTGKYFDVYWK